MKKEFKHIERKGLPGGPNEMFTYVTGVFSTEGYKRNSPDVSNPFNIIPSGSITMKDVDFPVMGTDNLGNSEMMMPGNDYQFPGDQVFEVPMAKKGGGLLTKTMKCNDCGWSWKAVDGGKDVSTCHKCGGSALPKAQEGREQSRGETRRTAPSANTLSNTLHNVLDYFTPIDNSNPNRVESPHKPTVSTDPNAKYYTYNGLKNDVIKNLAGGNNIKKINTAIESIKKQAPTEADFVNNYGVGSDTRVSPNFNSLYNYYKNATRNTGAQMGSINLGAYSVGAGEDDKGRYISIYDKYDWDVMGDVKPKGWEIYDRIYEDEFKVNSIAERAAKRKTIPLNNVYQDGGSALPKAQFGTEEEVGQKVASIANSMVANKEDIGRTPLSIPEKVVALFDEDGLCRSNVCVEAVKEFYKKAGIDAIPNDVYNNRAFLENFEEYGFTEIKDEKDRQLGDVIQFYYGPDSENVKKYPDYLNFPYHMGVDSGNGMYIGDGSSSEPVSEVSMYEGVSEDGEEYKKGPFKRFRYTKGNTSIKKRIQENAWKPYGENPQPYQNGGSLPKAQEGIESTKEGFKVPYDPETGMPSVTIPEVVVHGDATPLVRHKKAYEINNPYNADEYAMRVYNSNKQQNPLLAPAIERMDKTKFLNEQKKIGYDKWKEDAWKFATEQRLSQLPQGTTHRTDYLNSMSAKEEELAKKYNPSLQTTYGTDFTRGANAVKKEGYEQLKASLYGPENNNYTEREKQAMLQNYEYIGGQHEGSVLAPLTWMSKPIQALYKDDYTMYDAIIGGGKNKATIYEDAITDPFLVYGAGKSLLTGAAKLGSTAGSKYLPNASKLNPNRFKPKEGMMYRGIGKEGMEDAVQSGIFRPKPSETIPAINIGPFDVAKRFDNIYYTPDFFTASKYGKGYVAEVPKGSANWRNRYPNKTWSQVADKNIPIGEGRILKKDWWQGYKEVPKQLPGSPNNFKSSIDWENWVKYKEDFHNNPDVIKHLNEIEETTKANGTWMKNPDGSAFKGTQEQFVIEQSDNFKNAFGDSQLLNPDGSHIKLYHGSPKKFEVFDESMFQLGDSGFSGSGIYTSPSKTGAESYTISGRRFHDGEIEPTIYELYGRGNNPITSKQLIDNSGGDMGFGKVGELKDKNLPTSLFNFHREGTPTMEQLLKYDVAIHNQRRGVSNIKPIEDAWEIVFPTNKQVKSAKGNILFDMTNPNIYKSVIGATLGGGAATQLDFSKPSSGFNNPQAEYQKGGEYTVKTGDTFYGIANKNDVSWEDLKEVNPGVDYEGLKLNQKIIIPKIKAEKLSEDARYKISEEKTKERVGKGIERYLSTAEIDLDGLKKGIAEAESISGVLMINPESTATGLYGQRFSELDSGELYSGTREEFAKDLEAQNTIFDTRFNEGFTLTETTPLKQDAYDLYREYKPQIKDFNYSLEDIAALSNFLGRQGTRNYFGNVLRDNKTLSEVFPTKFGEDAEQANKTPEEYLKITREYYQTGGEIDEFEMYSNYINGVYDSTEMEQQAEKIYDKLNRVYYRKAKALDMSAPNYIMSNIINRSGQ